MTAPTPEHHSDALRDRVTIDTALKASLTLAEHFQQETTAPKEVSWPQLLSGSRQSVLNYIEIIVSKLASSTLVAELEANQASLDTFPSDFWVQEWQGAVKFRQAEILRPSVNSEFYEIRLVMVPEDDAVWRGSLVVCDINRKDPDLEYFRNCIAISIAKGEF